jgi:hypothetical protein
MRHRPYPGASMTQTVIVPNPEFTGGAEILRATLPDQGPSSRNRIIPADPGLLDRMRAKSSMAQCYPLTELGGRAVDMEHGDLAEGNALFDFTAFVDQAAASSATILRRLLPVP